ncbi:MAG: extensin family protein [Rhizobiaceae bacterium]
MGLDVVVTTCHSCIMRILVRFFTFFAVGMLTGPVWGEAIPVPTKNPNAATSEIAVSGEVKTPDQNTDNRVYQSACPAVLNGIVSAKHLSPIENGLCGERSPLEVYEIAGVKLSGNATLNCRMATALAQWIPEIDQKSEELLGAGIATMISGTAFQCRRRNNAANGKISEHGFANALDITGFVLTDGKKIALPDGWPAIKTTENTEGSETLTRVKTTNENRFMIAVRDKACQHFTTVLGPNSNPLHANHFHLDLGCHDKTCTYRICE